MKWMEKSKRSQTVRMKHEDDYGMNEDSNLSQSVRASNKEDSQRTTTLTDNKKREATKTKDLQCMKTHALASTALTCSPSVSGHFAHCWDAFCNSCRQFNCCRCNHLLNFLIRTRILCRDSHCENGSSEVLSLHHPSVAADRRQLRTIQLKQNREEYKKSWKSLVWGFIQRRDTTSFTVLSYRFACIFT